MLDARRMQVLRAVVTSGSVTTAARDLGYTPSAISQQLAALEREAGVVLLEKAGRGVRPTEAGRMVAERASSIATILTDTAAELAAFRAGSTGRLRIRWAASVGSVVIPPAVTAYRGKNPGIRVEPCLSADPLREVVEGNADLALVAAPPDEQALPPGMHVVHLIDDPLRVVLPFAHHLAEQEVIDLADLAGEPWIERESGAARDESQQVTAKACAAAGFVPNVVLRADDFLTAQGFVAAGLGVRLTSSLGLRAAGSANVIVRPVRRPEPVIRIHAVVRESTVDNSAFAAMLDELRAAARDLASSGGERRAADL